MKSLGQINGGQTDLYTVNSVFFFIIFALNITDQIIKHQPIIERWVFTFPFLILAVLFLTKVKGKLDFLINIFLLILMTVQAETGDFSGLPFAFLLVFSIRKKEMLIVAIGIFILSVAAGAIINFLSIPQTFLMISLYLFMSAKYYYTIHLPTKALQNENKALKSRLDIIGEAKHLTDNQIILKYPFLDDTKIKSLRLLAAGHSQKEIAGMNEKSDRQQARLFSEIKRELGIIIDEDIYTLSHLSITAVKLDIVQVITRHKDF